MARVWVDYLIAIGWGVVGAVSMACGLAILLKVFDWLTPIDAIGFAIMPVPAAR